MHWAFRLADRTITSARTLKQMHIWRRCVIYLFAIAGCDWNLVVVVFAAAAVQIKDRLLVEEKRIEAFELRKNREQNRKFNKQVSELRKQEKVQERKAHNEEVTQIRRASDKDEKEGRLNKILGGGGGDKQAPTKSFKRQGLVSSCAALLWLLLSLLLLLLADVFCSPLVRLQDKKYSFGAKDRKMAKMNDKK